MDMFPFEINGFEWLKPGTLIGLEQDFALECVGTTTTYRDVDVNRDLKITFHEHLKKGSVLMFLNLEITYSCDSYNYYVDTKLRFLGNEKILEMPFTYDRESCPTNNCMNNYFLRDFNWYFKPLMPAVSQSNNEE